MSDVAIYKRHRDFLIAIIISTILFCLDFNNFISVSGVRGLIAFSAFMGVIAAIITSIIIFQKYERVIGKAKENELMTVITKVFKYPLLAAIFGAVLTFLLTIISIPADFVNRDTLVFLSTLADSILIFLVIYSFASLYEGISFLYRIVIGESTNNN